MPTPAIEFSASRLILHPRQSLLVNSPARYTVGTCGRRFGKTKGLLYKLAREACKAHRRNEVLYWWCAPTYARAVKAFEEFERAMKAVIRRASREDYSITLLNGVRLEFVSLKEWGNRKGDGLDGVIFDEAARCPAAAWDELISPALMDKKGWACLISTPLGRNWFYREHQKGLKDSKTYDPEYVSYQFPSVDNPYLDPAEIKKMRDRMPEDVFRQEVLAQFLLEGAGVFLGLRDLAPTEYEIVRGFGILEPHHTPVKNYLGVDLGKHQDFSVLHNLSVFDGVRPQTTYWERFTQMGWKEQEKKIVPLAKRLKAKVVIDSSGAGDRIYEELRDEGIDVVPFKFSSPSNRQALYKNLQIAVAKAVLCVPEDPYFDVFWEEMESFEYQLTEAGKLTVGPPEGEHDDTVAAVALACHGLMLDSANGDFSEFMPQNQLKIVRNLASIPKAVLDEMLLDANDMGGGTASPFGSGISSPFSGAHYFGGPSNGCMD